MSLFTVNSVIPRIQYIASAAETDFTYPFEIFEDSDLDVYLTPVGQTPDANTNKLTLGVDYTVTGAGETSGGYITLTTAATAGDIVTIIRDVPIERDTDYTTGGPFTSQSINNDLNRLIMLIQQVSAFITTRGLLYGPNEELDSGDTTLPKLPANTGAGIPIWTKNALGNLVAALLVENADATTLRSELLSATELAPGSEIVGHYSEDAGGATNVNQELQRINAYVKTPLDDRNIIIGGDFSLNPFQRGTGFNGMNSGQYVADRFKYVKVGAMLHNSSKSTLAPTVAEAGILCTHSLSLVCANADTVIGGSDYCILQTTLEGLDFLRIAQREFVLSFWVYATKTGIYCVSLGNYGADRIYVSEFAVDASETWQLVNIVVPASPATGTWDYTSGGVGLRVAFALAAGANYHGTNNTWNTSNVLSTASQVNACDMINNIFAVNLIQIIPGSIPHQFKRRSFAQELELCQRYYEKSYPIEVTPGTASSTSASYYEIHAFTNEQQMCQLNGLYRVIKRTNTEPSGAILFYSPATGLPSKVRNNNSNVDLEVLSLTGTSEKSTGFPTIDPAVGNFLLSAHWTADYDF